MAESGNATDSRSSSSSSNTSTGSDTLYDPASEINEHDDEQTLDEEETLAAAEAEDPSLELSSLQRESDLPLSELLALYGYRELQDSESPVEEDYASSEPMDDNETESEPDSSPKLRSLYTRNLDQVPDSSRLLRSGFQASEDEDDFDYFPEEDEWRKVNKTIMVGSDYQALIPEGFSHYDDALPYENEDKLLWDPTQLKKCAVEDFLKKIGPCPTQALSNGTQLKDDEQALFLLLQCGYNIEEALRRIRINAIPPTFQMQSLWSEDECSNFEAGIRSYGKNFHLIQQNKVRTRSIGELVQFYYLWKKSERHDLFGNRTKLEKRKYSIHPGLGDFMDRFLEDREGRDRSSSPSVSSEANKRLCFSTMSLKPRRTTDN